MQEADLLTFDAQQALRRTMEKYAGSCKLFLCCTSLNKIIDPVISRCMVIRLPAPSTDTLISILKNVSAREDVNGSDNFYKVLVEKCDRNVRRSILTLEATISKG
jgi:replication factor C subunit 3/5